MACEITSGFTLDCRDNAGGIKNIYILSGSIAGTTGATNGLLTDISGSGEFFKFELTKQTGDLQKLLLLRMLMVLYFMTKQLMHHSTKCSQLQETKLKF